MNTLAKNRFLPLVLTAGFGLVLTGRVMAQTFTTLHNFTGSDGAQPIGGVILSGNTLYGTTSHATVFRVNTDGSGFTNLASIPDGGMPYSALTLNHEVLYGTTVQGPNDKGTVFAVNIDGTSFTNLHGFTGGTDGLIPYAGLLLSDYTLYGTASLGGSWGGGTVFAVNTDGTGFTNLHSFTGGSGGEVPYGRLILKSNTLYGTTQGGGSSGNGIVFAVNTDGTGFTTLHSFTGNDGGQPIAGLVLSSNTLYGTTFNGGSSGNGTVFAVNTDGTGFTNLHSFRLNSDGGYPQAVVIISGKCLYGTASGGGSSNEGTVFKVNTDGTGFTNLHTFRGPNTGGGFLVNSDGAYPHCGLVLSDNTLYGTAQGGGNWGNGTVFSICFRPELGITPLETNLILSWPANYAGFDYTGYALQSTTNLASPIWTTNSAAPVVVNGQNTVTNPISRTAQFFRLSQ